MHPLEQQLASLRRRLRRLVVVRALGWMGCAGVGAAVAAGLADYVLRFRDPGIRLILSAAVVGAVAWACYRYLYRGLAVRLRDVDLALRLQRRFPRLGDTLASSVEFLKQSEDDPAAGSVALRRAVIARTTAESEAVDFRRALDARPAVRAAVWSAAAGLLALVLFALDPPAARTALARLANPLGGAAWPQRHHLVLRDRVDRVARGQTFEVEVEAAEGEKLPAEVRIHYRFAAPDGPLKEEAEPMRFVQEVAGPGPRKEVAVARREGVTRPFSYRVTGGDDRAMEWIAVQVLEPPVLDPLEVRLAPPDYTGLPPEPAGRLVRALVGTRVEIAARSSKRLRSAALCVEGAGEVPARLHDGGFALSVGLAGKGDALVIEKSGVWSFRLTDEEGLSGDGGGRWDVRAVPDAPPTVTIEEPAAILYVTPRAKVPVRVKAKDDLAVRRVALAAAAGDAPGASHWEVPLYEGPDRARPRAAGFSSGADLAEDLPPIEHRWDLAGLELQPGAQIALSAIATDYRGQTGQSEPRRLVLITPEELADRIAARQSAVLAELARVLQMQRQGRAQVAAQEMYVAEVGPLGQIELDRLRGAELNQRQINHALTSRSDGVPMLVLGLLADLENNQVDSPDVRRRMEDILAGIGQLERGALPAIGRELTAAIKAAQVALEERGAGAGPAPGPAVAASLALAGTHQDAVIRSLEEMLGRLAQWDNYRRFHREVGQLLREQEELGRRSADVARRTLTREVKDLLPQEAADLKLLARSQLELARRLDRIQQEMGQAAAQLEEADPLAAETVADALHRARELGIGGTMRAAGGDLQENRMGQAVGRQKKIVQDLQEVLDILANRRESELARLVKKLREAEGDIASLAGEQEGARKEFEGAAGQPEAQRRAELERAAGRQAQIEEDARRMARRLERLLANRAARTTREASDKMQGAGQSGRGGDASRAASQAAAARDGLQKARDELAAQRLQAEVELALEQLARLEDAVRNVHNRQARAIEETGRLDGLKRQAQDRLTPAQQASLAELAREQDLLRTEVAELIEKLAGAKAFVLVLEGVSESMGRAAGLLARRETGPPTRQAQQDALARLAQMLEALEPEELAKPDAQAPGGQGGTGQGRAGGVQTLAEMKLLKLVQESINARTQALEKARGGAENLDPDVRVQYQALSLEQGRLAALLAEMLRAQPDPEDHPEDLP